MFGLVSSVCVLNTYRAGMYDGALPVFLKQDGTDSRLSLTT